MTRQNLIDIIIILILTAIYGYMDKNDKHILQEKENEIIELPFNPIFGYDDYSDHSLSSN